MRGRIKTKPRQQLTMYLKYNDGRNNKSRYKTRHAVNVVLKNDQRSGLLTEGIVKDILTSAPKHPRGIKVRLQDGQIGRVQEIVEE